MGKQRQFSYDGAGRLIQVVDAATNTTETYVWNADGTLASFPGPGYTRLLEYDEEGRLVRIRRDYGGGNVQLAYEYGYGFDGGRRWRKDYLNGVWTRYPCGVACGAGELVEQTSDLSGSQWTTSALYLQGISLVRRNSEWHHFDPLGTAQVITNSSAQVVSNNVYDTFGVLRYQQGSAQTPWRWRDKKEWDESFLLGGTTAYFARSAVTTNNVGDILLRLACEHACRNVKPDYLRRACVEACIAVGKGLVKPAPKPVPKPEPQPPGKEAECAKGKCRTNVPGDIATCCPDGRPFCGPSKDYVPICGIQVKPPVPEPPKPDEE